MKIKLILGLMGLALLQACSNSGQSKVEVKNDSTAMPAVGIGSVGLNDTNSAESRAIRMVTQIPEIEEMRVFVDKQSNGQNHIRFVIEQQPYKETPYYMIAVIEDNGDFVITHYRFLVNPDTPEMMYYDIAENKKYTLDEWRSKVLQSDKAK